MILFNGVNSVIEALYLNDKLSNKVHDSNIIVNPDRLYKNKLIWINTPNYDLSLLEKISEYNQIKSRLKIPNAGFDYQYIPYRNDRIKKLTIDIAGKVNYSINKYDLSKLILFNTTSGNIATKLPNYNQLDINNARSHCNTAYDLYLLIIENSIKNGIILTNN